MFHTVLGAPGDHDLDCHGGGCTIGPKTLRKHRFRKIGSGGRRRGAEIIKLEFLKRKNLFFLRKFNFMISALRRSRGDPLEAISGKLALQTP